MKTVWWAVSTFLTLGVSEAVVKPLAKAVIDRSLRRVLPHIYARLDQEMPTLLRTATPEVMTSQIATVITQATGKAASAQQIARVAQLYDPLKAALRNVSPPER